jgi:cytochrome c
MFCIGIYCFFWISAALGLAIFSSLIFSALYYVVFKGLLSNSPKQSKDKKISMFASSSLVSVVVFASFFYSTVNVKDTEYFESESYVNGKKLFLSCTACHRLSEENFVGPHLVSVYGREVGSVEGYNYSSGMREAKFIWTDDKLRSFLTNQNAVVPGTRMVISPLNDGAINDIIEYMKRI